jgi:3-methyladenine DNA glycosylase AlkC
MAEPLKNLIHREGIAAAARRLRRVWPPFDAASFERQAAQDLEALELKARAMQIADALEATLPDDFAQAAGLIEAALAAAPGHERVGDGRTTEQGLAGWIL